MESRDRILASFHAAQRQSGSNWLSPQALRDASARYGLSGASIKGIASYYSMFSLAPRGRHIIRLCVSPVCRMHGSVDLLGVAAEACGAEPGGTDPSGCFSLETVQCLGRCAGAPAMMVDDEVYAALNPEKLRSVLAALRERDEKGLAPALARAADEAAYAAHIGPGAAPCAGGPCGAPAEVGGAPVSAGGEAASPEPVRVALRYPRLAEPADARAYEAAGGFSAFRKALGSPPEALIEEMSRAKLRGRGGAGFPTGIKERAAAGSACSADEGCERFVVCNADEGEPGTFKDRIILERSPQLLIEGMLISAYAIGARKGYIYLRGEYALAIERVRAALASAYEAGFLGEALLGSDFSFDLELRLGGGSYLCGEELTLIESLEGKRGYPRIKPPFPAEAGLWGKPTLVNNVETLAALPWVIERGADAYLALGTEGSPGTKIFCLSGDLARPGYGEWEMGVTLGELIEAAGGALDAQGRPAERPYALLLGGAAGCFVSGSALELRMDYDELKAAGASLGSGAVIALGPGRSLLDCLCAIMDFFKHESCGKCVPCRVGTSRLSKAAYALAAEAKAGAGQDFIKAGLEALAADAERIAKASLCPLGQSPILSLKSAVRNLTYYS
jgi:NADH:ubiquinone oxidoreductase subunit F (NADH-binding)/NADH:ubiquinone oxidoreductase subunit E